jgi:hypothetical protein
MDIEKKIDLSKADKIKITVELINQVRASIHTGLLKERFWRRKAITDGRAAEAMLGNQSADLRKQVEWLEFLEEVEKEFSAK